MPNTHSDMTIGDILNIKPKAKEIFFEYGILSENKEVLAHQTLREVCNSHGLTEEKTEEIVQKLRVLPN